MIFAPRPAHRVPGVPPPAESGPASDPRIDRAVGLLEEHGTALLRTARQITGDADLAWRVVADVVWEFTARYDAPLAGRSTRRHLSTGVTDACRARSGNDDPGRPTVGG